MFLESCNCLNTGCVIYCGLKKLFGNIWPVPYSRESPQCLIKVHLQKSCHSVAMFTTPLDSYFSHNKTIVYLNVKVSWNCWENPYWIAFFWPTVKSDFSCAQRKQCFQPQYLIPQCNQPTNRPVFNVVFLNNFLCWFNMVQSLSG